MRSIVSVTVASDESALTTLERVKSELGITGTDAARDLVLSAKINEASDDIEAALGFRVPLESVSEVVWLENNDLHPEFLVLDRTPVVSIASVTVDDVLADPSTYRIDSATGQLYALCNGYPSRWIFCKSVVVAYSGGYSLPIDEGADCTLPAGIQGACVELMSDYWAAKGRDPSVKSEEIPGVIRTDYWVGAVGEAGELPPRVVMKLAPFRRAQV